MLGVIANTMEVIMITGKKLKQLSAKIPDDAQIYAYEGEDVGFGIYMPDGSFQWIRARDTSWEDDQPGFDL